MGQARKDRAKAYNKAAVHSYCNEQAINGIEQHNFDRLVRTGIVRAEQPNMEWLGLDFSCLTPEKATQERRNPPRGRVR